MIHELDSLLLYIHPPLSILGYIFIFSLFYIMTIQAIKRIQFKQIKKLMYFTWFINLLGLITGMIWAGIAWNSFWSWDPKETITLMMFSTLCISIIQYEKRKTISFIFLISSIFFIVINLIITFGNYGLHSYGF